MDKIRPLAELPNGKKIYSICGQKFEVPPPYALTKQIGVGAYGIVCAAQVVNTAEKVAIKKIPRALDDLREGKRILREMEIMTTLRHANLIRLHHFLRPQSKATFEDIYLVMDLYDADLHRIIKSGQALTTEHHQYFMVQAFRGLHHLHSAKVMHRDMKPSNLLVNADCALAICDFGLARDDQRGPAADLTQYVVTRWYRPPEVLGMGPRPYTNAVDVWSLGLIFAELIVGRTLLPGSDYIKQLMLIMNLLGTPSGEDLEVLSPEARTFLAAQPKHPARPFKELFPMATPEVCDLLSKLLVFHPEKRISAKEVIEHPYFKKFRDPAQEAGAENPFVSKYNREYTAETLRNALWDLIVENSPPAG
ncbi:unnamed protein product [Phytomonas sp. Hart1]|nr:unnamed protein product [Phytomonas sp. Hart1]|eukprot:CCW71867.1 unnamed protein product [Phytomonas sp. isolate Hart1]